LGLPVWTQDEGGPYQAIPQPGQSWEPEGEPARQPHEYIRGGTAKLLTLFRPATGDLHAEPVEHATNVILHPWLKDELTAILDQTPILPGPVPLGRRWIDWDYHLEAASYDEQYPPLRLLLIWDNLRGHQSVEIVEWCRQQGIGLLYTPLAGSWLNMAESIQRILQRRALEGQHPEQAETILDWLRQVVRGWNRQPTPFVWGGKRHARRDRAYARRHRLGGSGATIATPLPGHRHRSVRSYHQQPTTQPPVIGSSLGN
jgi:transposase